jgi:omega-hydroxy-beta-dihydromenaquinone-9 sulfotransferase
MGVTGTRRRPFQLRVWHGMTASAWFGMLRRNRFQVSPSRFYLVLLISVASAFNSLLAAIQELVLGKGIRRTELRTDPIFVLGHWRSGTTLAHELLAIDPRHNAPSTYACLAPSHFLISQKLLSPLLRYLLPKRRSQDNVRVDLEHAQEDEWALCVLGLPSPYLAVAFPSHLPHAPEYVSLDALDPEVLACWKTVWRRFLQAVAFSSPKKRLIIKSPLHTARIQVLLELFPDARFVHVVRDPYAVYPSTMRLWKRLAEDEGLQMSGFEQLDEFVLDTYAQLHRSFEQNRHKIRSERICQIRYEDLVRDPVASLRSIYAQLDLGEFDAVLPLVESKAAEMSQFEKNRFDPSAEETEKIRRHWGEFGEQLGYAANRAA